MSWNSRCIIYASPSKDARRPKLLACKGLAIFEDFPCQCIGIMLGSLNMLNLCIECGLVYESKREWQRFCSRKCSNVHYSKLNYFSRKAALSQRKDLVLKVVAHNFPEYRHASFCYGWYRNEYLYIGSTVLGFTRFVSHHVMNVLEPVQLDDELHLWPVPQEELAGLEKSLIEALKPKYNCCKWRAPITPSEAVAPVKRPIAPCCKYCNKPFIPVGRGERRLYCDRCALVDKLK